MCFILLIESAFAVLLQRGEGLIFAYCYGVTDIEKSLFDCLYYHNYML